MLLKNIRAFVCVPAVGKSYLCKICDKFVDMDDMKARYKYAMEGASERDMEAAKGNRGQAVRRGSVDFIKQKTLDFLQKTDKILLFAPNPQIVDMLVAINVPYCLVYHSPDVVEEIAQRMRSRGNRENYIHAMLDPIDEFYKASVEDGRPAMKIELHKGEFLSDYLLGLVEV